jgi:hypothetical protein
MPSPNPFLALEPRLAQAERTIFLLQETVTRLRFELNHLRGQGLNNNDVVSGGAGTVNAAPTPGGGGGDGTTLAASGDDRNKEKVATVAADDLRSYIRAVSSDGKTLVSNYFFLGNVFFPDEFSSPPTNKLCLHSGVNLSDGVTPAGPMKVTFKTVNLGDGEKKYAFPAGAWC